MNKWHFELPQNFALFHLENDIHVLFTFLLLVLKGHPDRECLLRVFSELQGVCRTAAMLPSPCLFFKRGEFCNSPHRKYKRYYENPPKFLKLENRLDEAFISYQTGFLK